MTTIRAPHAPDDGQRRRGNGGRRRRRGAEDGRAAGTGRVARRTADVGGAGAGWRESNRQSDKIKIRYDCPIFFVRRSGQFLGWTGSFSRAELIVFKMW